MLSFEREFRKRVALSRFLALKLFENDRVENLDLPNADIIIFAVANVRFLRLRVAEFFSSFRSILKL